MLSFCLPGLQSQGKTKINKYISIFTWTGFRFLSKQKIFCVEVKLLPVFQHGFLRTAENVYIHNFHGIVWEKVFPFNFVIGIFRLMYCLLWQMLKPLNSCLICVSGRCWSTINWCKGRCYCLLYALADVIPMCGRFVGHCRLMLLPLCF